MNSEQAKPGDRISITVDGDFLGDEFLVVECPNNRRDGPNVDKTWVKHQGHVVCIMKPEDYQITSRYLDNGVGKVDVSLRQQRDDNLRSIFS